MSAKQTIHPMQRINSMSTTGSITPKVLSGILSSNYVDSDTKEYIVHAVKSYETHIAELEANKIQIVACIQEIDRLKKINGALLEASRSARVALNHWGVVGDPASNLLDDAITKAE